MRTPIILGFSVPALLVLVLIYGGMAYSPSKRLEYPERYGLNDRIAAARQAMHVRINGAGPTNGEPQIEITQTVHDFGIMPQHEIGQTKFYIRSVGTGRVDLMDAGKSCQCVGFKISDRQLDPGEVAEVTMEWRTSELNDEYSQVVLLRTNCKDLSQVRLEVKGRVTKTFAAEPTAFQIGRLIPTSTQASASAWIYSYEWDQIEDLKVVVSDSRFEVSIDDEREGAPDHPLAKWMRRLTLRTPEGLASGYLNAMVTVTGQSTDGKPLKLELPVEGHVTKRLSISGATIDSAGLIEIGTLSPFQGAQRVFTVRVHDPELKVALKEVVSNPSCLTATWEPISEADGLYRLTLIIPEDRPDGAFAGSEVGWIRMHFDHPRIEPVELKVSYVALSNLGR